MLGDLEEKFYVELKKESRFTANLNYWYQALNYLRPFAIRKLKSYHSNQSAMFQNYFKIGWRNLSKQKMYSSIKIGGFAMGIAACFLITLFIMDELRYDLHYRDGNRIYRVVGVLNDNGTVHKDTWFAAPFAKVLKEDYPEIESTGRINSSELFGAGSNEIRPADKLENSYEEGFAFVDQDLLNILELPMVHGDPEHALDAPNSIVITKRKADKYFPNENPVGKLMIINDDERNPFTIGGVLGDLPATSHFQFDFLMTLTGREFWPGEQTYWRASNYHTYVKLAEGVDPQELQRKATKGTIEKHFLPAMIEAGMADAEKMMKNAHLEFQPVRDIHLTTDVRDGMIHGDKRLIWLFGGVAVFILLIACINFVNLSTARSANRAKEVGLRKVVGSVRGGIIQQFLSESLLFSSFSFALGILGAWLLLPYFNAVAGKELLFPWKEWWLFPALGGSAIAVGMLAGIYPSFYLSSFRPIDVLKGKLSKGSKHSGARSALVVFQFTTSIILIIGTFVIYRQMEFMLNTKVGYEKDQVLLIQGSNTLGNQIISFKDELLRLSQVRHVSISDYLPVRGTKRNGNGFWKEGKINEDREVIGQMWIVDGDYVKTMGMKIVEGRDFNTQMATDTLGVIVNQAMVRELGLTDPVGKVITNGESMPVIGVVEDFHFETMKENIRPLAMRLGISPSIVSIKVSASEMADVITSITKVWKRFSPNQPFRYTFLDESYARMYEDVQRTGRIFTSFAVLAIVVACLGLFALSAFMVEQRTKELSIRLILGASPNSIFRLLSGNFVWLVTISFLVAAPVAWLLMNKWLDDYVYKIDLTWDVFILSGLISMLIALITISYQAVKAAMTNPASTLRTE